MGKSTLPPTILVVFGISGDLSRRYLLPALSQIGATNDLPAEFRILGVSRRNLDIRELLRAKDKPLIHIAEVLQMNLGSDADYIKLKNKIAVIGSRMSKRPQVIFYFAVPPAATLPIVRHLGRAGLNSKNFKLLLEKPFGIDVNSAEELIKETAKFFPEGQVYRIDHYLAKEVAQNIIVFLGSNALFRSVWDAAHIEKIQIVAAERIGIESREDYYEQTGALRDFAQSHLLQLAALVLMEPCSDPFNLNQVSVHRRAALKAIKPVSPRQIKKMVAAQYDGYRQEVGDSLSETETFIALDVYSSQPRWRGVPIQLVTGKRLSEKLTEVRISFKKYHASQTNLLVLRIQPREGIELDLWVKEPGYDRRLQRVAHRFDYAHHFGRLPHAYEQVLIDVMRGSYGLFASSQEVLASWQILEPIQKQWAAGSKKTHIYKPGSTIEDVLASV